MYHSTYKYIPASQIYAQIEEELSSYFNTGAVDSILFDKYTQFVISQFNKTYFIKKEMPLNISNGYADLPEDFESMKEVYACETQVFHMPLPGAKYYLRDCRISSRYKNRCGECFEQSEPCSECNVCENKDYSVVHRITGSTYFDYTTTKTLIPDAFTHKYKCSSDCKVEVSPDYYNISEDSCRIRVGFNYGVIHIVYYSNALDPEEEILIPDRPNFKDYLIKYLKFKIFESLFHSTTDETFNQMSQKYQLAKRDMEEAYIDANIESKQQNKIQVVKSILNTKRRNNKYWIKY